MGYFPNGTSAEDYASQYCSRCVHGPHQEAKPCMVWFLHLLGNYEDCNDEESPLHILIPKSKDGLWNEECTMFFERDDAPDERQGDWINDGMVESV